jgi:hypothetical protein
MNNRYNRIVSVILMLTAILAGARLAAQPAGEEWEYQGVMQMMGMKMPLPATKICQQAEQDMTPPMESNCTVSDVLTEGNTTSFTMQCGPPNPMEGSGTTTRTGDSLESLYTLKSAEGEMTITSTGKKLGSCPLGGN